MIYELYFQPATGRWRIRITIIYLFFFHWSWDAMHKPVPTAEPTVHEFPTYDAAAKHAEEIGLPKAYMLRQRSKGYTSWLQGEGCHGTS